MNWIPIAAAVIGLVGPYAIKAGEAAAKKLGEDIYTQLKKRFIGDDDKSAANALESYVAEPDLYEGALQKTLTRKAEADPDGFGGFLTTLAEKGGDIGGIGGQTAIGSNIAQADRGSTASVTVNKE